MLLEPRDPESVPLWGVSVPVCRLGHMSHTPEGAEEEEELGFSFLPCIQYPSPFPSLTDFISSKDRGPWMCSVQGLLPAVKSSPGEGEGYHLGYLAQAWNSGREENLRYCITKRATKFFL